MLDDLLDKLRMKFNFSEETIKAVAGEIAEMGECVGIEGDVQVVAEDPEDDKSFECAVLETASHIVSGDRHLRLIGKYRGVRVLSPAEFLKELNLD